MADNFLTFLQTYVGISVIAGIFTFKLISSFMENIINPILDYFIKQDKFKHFNIIINDDGTQIKATPATSNTELIYRLNFGQLLRDIIIWLISMIILYQISKAL
jgi:large-conductance mechanosensitive channel